MISVQHSFRYGAVYFALLCMILIGTPKTLADEEQDAIFKWYDSLGMPSFADKPFVKVHTGAWVAYGDTEPIAQPIHAFLITEKNEQFTIMTLGLEQRILTQTANGTPEYKKIGFAKLDLKTFAENSLDRIHKEGPFDRQSRSIKVSPAVELLVIARACKSNALPDTARDLLLASKSMSNWGRDVNAPPATFQQKLGEDLAHAQIWQTILKFQETAISWKEIHRDFVSIHTNFPYSKHAERCKESAALVAKMIAENEQHKTPANLDILPVDQRVAELIFQLQYQNGRQYSQPGWCDIFYDDSIRTEKAKKAGKDPNSVTKSPATQLVNVGHDAVPQLIKALQDKRFTRSVGYHRDFYFSHRPLTVSECCKTILQQIAGRSFDRDSTAQQATEWWQQMQSKGEKQMLIEAVQAGDHNSYGLAKKLLEKYPDDAFAAIVKGYENADSQFGRSRMIDVAAQTGPKAEAFIYGKLQSKEIYVKFAVGEALLETKYRQAVVDHFTQSWPKLLKQHWLPSIEQVNGKMVMEPESLISFVAALNDPKAIRSLHDEYDSMRIRARMAIVTTWYPESYGASTGGGIARLPRETEFTEKVDKEIEALLIHAMSDTERSLFANGSWASLQYHSPRMCDLAGRVVAHRYPDKYKFDFQASSNQREFQRTKIINRWRTDNKLERLPAFKPTIPLPVDKPLLDKVIRSIATSTNGATLKQDVLTLKKLGPAALPAIRKTLNGLPKAHAARGELELLITELPHQISQIDIAANSAPLDAIWKNHIRNLKGSRLTADTIIETLKLMGNLRPEDASGIVIWCERINPEVGFHLTIDPTKTFRERGGTQRMWDATASGKKNGEFAFVTNNGASLDYVKTDEAHQETRMNVQKLLATPINNRIEMLFALVLGES